MEWSDEEIAVPRKTALLTGGGPALRSSLASESPGTALESTAGPGIARDERLRRLDDTLAAKAVAPEIKQLILHGAREGLPKVEDGADKVTRRELLGLEAVILTDGSRPSLTIRNGFVDTGASEVGDWAGQLRAFQSSVERVIRSVGRINVPVKPFFAGTAFVIAPDLVMTNRHVAEEIAIEASPGEWELRWPGATTIDFVAEAGRETEPAAEIAAIAFAGPDPILKEVEFRKLDVAFLRCKPIAGHDWPRPLSLEAEEDKLHEGRAFCAIGFPGQPWIYHKGGKPPPGYETAEVINSVFAKEFKIKKLAPGRVDAVPGTFADDVNQWIVGHDASTLGGNSGSAIIDIDEDGGSLLAIHFGGLSREANYGHGLAAIAKALPAIG